MLLLVNLGQVLCLDGPNPAWAIIWHFQDGGSVQNLWFAVGFYTILVTLIQTSYPKLWL